MRKRAMPVLPVLALSLAVLAGCGGSSTSVSTRVDLSGSYVLQSLTLGGATFTPSSTPPATGTLVLTATNYTLDLNVAGQAQPDAGTYTATSDGKWSQISTTSSTQSTGTYSLSGSTLTVNATAQGQTIGTVWTKQ